LNNTISIQNTSSANIDLPDGVVDLIVTDPPYYDSIDYTALSEFFRPWFEVLIRNTFDSKVCLKNDTRNEAIAELANSSVKNKRQGNHYHKMMKDIFTESKRVLKDSGKLVFIYGHKTLEGWEVIANAVKDAALHISNIYPLDMERPARPRAMSHQSLNGVVVFDLLKEKSTSSIEDYFKNIEEVQPAHIPIHLAGLACKMYTNENISFQESYQTIVNYYQQWVIAHQRFIDPVLTAYIDAMYPLVELTKASKQLLERHRLMNDKGELYTLEEMVSNGYHAPNTVFDTVLHIYNEFSNNTHMKINIDSTYQKDIANFFAAIAGVELNTLAKRSFASDKKVARLILSKINID
jgi:DNA modification methylase